MIAEDLMTEELVTVTETATVGEALTVMSERGVRHLPVVRGADVIGMLSDRDFSGLGVAMINDEESYDQLRARLSQPVTVLMSGGVVTVGRDAEVSEIVDLMLDEKLSAIPVVETGTSTLNGIVSYVDVLKAAQPLFE